MYYCLVVNQIKYANIFPISNILKKRLQSSCRLLSDFIVFNIIYLIIIIYMYLAALVDSCELAPAQFSRVDNDFCCNKAYRFIVRWCKVSYSSFDWKKVSGSYALFTEYKSIQVHLTMQLMSLFFKEYFFQSAVMLILFCIFFQKHDLIS